MLAGRSPGRLGADNNGHFSDPYEASNEWSFPPNIRKHKVLAVKDSWLYGFQSNFFQELAVMHCYELGPAQASGLVHLVYNLSEMPPIVAHRRGLLSRFVYSHQDVDF
jgi:hypothetical protein